MYLHEVCRLVEKRTGTECSYKWTTDLILQAFKDADPPVQRKRTKPLHDKAVGQICIHYAIYRMSSDLHPSSDKKYVTHNLKAGLNSNGLFEALIDKLM